jgi:hypothetical protein
LHALVRQGQAGLVVETFASQRIALHLAAARTLHEEIDRCVKAGDEEAALQLDEIARELATHAPQINGEALGTLAAIAERILAIPSQVGKSDRLRHCHVVLKEEAERQMEEQARSPAGKTKSAFNPQDRTTGETATSRSNVSVAVAPLAGGGLVATPSDTQPRRLPAQVTNRARPLANSDPTSTSAAATSPFNLPSRDRASAQSASHASEETVLPASNRPTNAANVGQNNFPQEKAVAPSSRAGQGQPPIPRDMARLLELAERVRFGDAPQSAATKAELQWLGIDEVQLRLARGAVDGDPRVRKDVAEALARVETVDARGWLLWLSHDRDTEVRRAAISLLATASDPVLRKRVRQAAESDDDPGVRQQARTALAAGGERP